MSTLLVIFLIFILTIYYGITLHKKKANRVVLPPGPRGIPILGNLHQIAKNAPLKFSQWAQEYGKLYTIYFGNKPALVVNDVALMKQLFGMPASTGTFSNKSELFNMTYLGSYGVINSEGGIWKEQREFFMKTVKRLSRTTQTQLVIREEIEDLSDWILTQINVQGTVHLSERLKMTTGNILWYLAVGEKEKTNVAELLEEWMKCLTHASNRGLTFFSWPRYIAPKLTGYTALVQATRNIHEFVGKYFEDPCKNEENREDILSAYINRVNSTHDEESSFYGEEGLKHSFASLMSLLIAGSEATATTINWLIFYLVANPDVQRKVQREIDNVIGEHGDPTLEDKRRMPYTQAVIEETLRMSSLVPFGVIHVLMEDVSFLQYKLPKGLHLIANIFRVQTDPDIWGDPNNFRPERFLKPETNSQSEDNSNRKVDLKEYVVAFQPGKRTCPGESFARDIIFFTVTKLLNKIQFSPENGRSEEEYMEPSMGYALNPQNLGVVASERRKEDDH